jgi:penicillin-binding protein 1C
MTWLRRHKVLSGAFLAALVCAVWLAWPPGALFPGDYSTLVYDSRGRLLRATLAADEQYRFPPGTTQQSLPAKYLTALVSREDKRFYSHPGVDPLALAGAVATNVKAGRRVRGGSTIPMQVVRLADPKPRTYFNKFRECLSAFKLSLHRSKEEVLQLYAGHVPMGGNVVGVHAASWIYFGKRLSEITWAEAALLVVLPNSPSTINLERERPRLLEKRNRLLQGLFDEGEIDHVALSASSTEPLPDGRRELPFDAPHFTTMALGGRRDGRAIVTTLDSDVQATVEEAARRHHFVLEGRGIGSLAVVVAETGTGKIRAYVGSHDFFDRGRGGQVDGVRAARSTGSTLKPFLVARALDRGPWTMASVVQDVPTFYGTFAPQNASQQFCGLTTVDRLLIESLNVPSVRLLNAYGLADFYDFLVSAGLEGLFRGPDGYGLTLVIGGAEASLLELTQLYASLGSMGRKRPLRFTEDDDTRRRSERLFSEGAAWQVLDVLTRLSRPGVEYYWDRFDNRIPVAWKTGTSYGQKDAWAVGVNRQWTIGVWAGNFDGAGNASLTGAKSAAPLLFSLFNAFTRRDEMMWFDKPAFDLKGVECCRQSGYPAGQFCEETARVERPKAAHTPGTCPFHRRYVVDSVTGESVCSLCWHGVDTQYVTRFVVSPGARDILHKSGREVDVIPAHAADCPTRADAARIELVYPVDGVKIFIPRDFDGQHEKIVFHAQHQRPSVHLFWYINGSLAGETAGDHRLPVALAPGEYRLTVQDEEGYSETVCFAAYRTELP